MLYTLDINVPDDLPVNEARHARSIVLNRMAGVLSDVVGATGSVRTIDLDSPTPATADDRPDLDDPGVRYSAGYSEGFTKGWAMAMTTRAVVSETAALPEVLPRVAAGLRAAAADPVPEYPEPEFPDRMPAGAALNLGPLIIDDPDYPGRTTTAAELARRYAPDNGPDTATLPAQTMQPAGRRPTAGPGAPISAWDSLTPDVATAAYAFPERPDIGATHIDSEDAVWEFDDWARDHHPYWQRMTYPAQWGEEVPGTSVVTLTVEDERPRNVS